MPQAETTFDIPLFFDGGLELAKADDGKRLCFKGWATTARRDHKQERVYPDGLDFSYVLKKPEDGGGGGIRWKHTPNPAKGEGFDDPKYAQVAVVNSITKGKHPKSGEPGIFVEGEFYNDAVGRDIFEKQLAMQELGRGFGLSVEGAIKARDPRDKTSITKAIVRNIALDMHPMNPDARIEAFYKAMGAGDAPDDDDDDRDPGEFEPDPDDIEEEKRRKKEEAEEADADKALDSDAIQPIAPESLDGSPSSTCGKRKRKRLMKDDLKKAFDELTADEKRAFLAECGAVSQDENPLRKAMDDLEETNDRLQAQLDGMDTLEKAFGVPLDDMPSGSLARTAAEALDFQAALAERVIAQEPVLAELAKALDSVTDLVKGFAPTMAAIDQAMGRAQAPTGLPSGVAYVPHPGDTGGAQGETLTKAQAEQHVLQALRKARAEGGSGTLKANLEEQLQRFSFFPADATFLKAEIEALEHIS